MDQFRREGTGGGYPGPKSFRWNPNESLTFLRKDNISPSSAGHRVAGVGVPISTEVIKGGEGGGPQVMGIR